MRKMPKEAYVLVRIGWQYNDEYYESPNIDHCGQPTKVFTTYEKALDECKRLNAQPSGMTNSADEPITEQYEVVAVEII
jgi:hypothetical protein